LAFLIDAYTVEEGEKEKRTVLKLHPKLAPIKLAVFPLMKKPELKEMATKLFDDYIKHFVCDYDEIGSIGKRYRRHDEIGTPFCLTVDYDSLNDNTVTVRDRDTMEQVRISTDKVIDYVKEKIR
jgi:glycyl-tRNA synthetase